MLSQHTKERIRLNRLARKMPKKAVRKIAILRHQMGAEKVLRNSVSITHPTGKISFSPDGGLSVYQSSISRSLGLLGRIGIVKKRHGGKPHLNTKYQK